MPNSSIQSDPLNRVPAGLVDLLSKEELFFDVHCHVFSYRDVPDRFLGVRIPANERFLSSLENLLHNLIRNSDSDRYSNLAYFINFLKSRTSEEITTKLMDYYKGRKVVLCPLMMDMQPGIGGRVEDDFQIQIEKMKELRKIFTPFLLPFLALDPNNPAMKENFRKSFAGDSDQPFFGIKIYPSLGYLPTHPDLMEIYEVCERCNIPVTAHCSGAIVHGSRGQMRNILGIYRDTTGVWKQGPVTRRFSKKRDYAEFFNHPLNWKPALEKFPRLKLNLAHFGGDEAWEAYTSGSRKSWVTDIIELMESYRGLFADFSYTFYNKKYTLALKSLLSDQSEIKDRILFGSDYYMVVTEGHFRKLLTDFETGLGPELFHILSCENPRKFLFGKKMDHEMESI